MKNFFKIFLLVAILVLSVNFVFAQTICEDDEYYDAKLGTCVPVYIPSYSAGTNPGVASTPTGIPGIIVGIQRLLNSIIPILVALGVLYFVWGVVRFVIADGEEAKKKGKDVIVYGVIGLAVIGSLWGLVNIVVKTFNLSGTAPSLEPLKVASSSSCTLIGNSNAKLQDLLCYLTQIINDFIIPLIFAVATVAFVWGILQFFLLNPGEEAKRTQGKQFMIWGVIALAVMISIWGLVGLLGGTFGIDSSVLPQVRTPAPGQR